MSEETPRQKLSRLFFQAIREADTGKREVTGAATNMWVDSPIFGRCRLIEHPGDQTPMGTKLGYVELADAPGKYQSAMWLGKEWRTRNNKPFGQAIVRWFDLRRFDGQTII